MGGFEILDGVVIGPGYFSKDGKQSSALICPPIWAFNYGITNALNRLSHPVTGSNEFQSVFNSLLDDLVSEILIYFENRLKIIVVSEKLKYKMNSVPEVIKAYKNLASVEFTGLGDVIFLKALDRARGERHHTHHRYDSHYFIGSDDYNTIEKLQGLVRKVQTQIQNLDQKLSLTHKDYEIKVERLPSAIKAEWTAVNHALDMTQGGKIVPQRPTTGLDPRQVKYFAIQLNYNK
ncbi:MAG: hypothetical protein Q8Q86_00800 [Candidatus Daviesbacteria bacterium]|nr:hypothetical protein [Candidatus Daviesbacteria bacterium]